jgi:hypothetical protein
MTTKGNDPTGERDRETRIAEMKQKLQEIAGGKMIGWESDALPGKQREEFWRDVLAFESGPFTTDFERLVNAGVELPAPESMDDATLTAKLWEVIRSLAQMRVFLSRTDHLSDRELYAHLWSQSLREEIPTTDLDPHAAWHVDLVSTGSAEHTDFHLKFYADEKERRDWLASFPDYLMPPHENPPYDRDRHLPQLSADAQGWTDVSSRTDVAIVARG